MPRFTPTIVDRALTRWARHGTLRAPGPDLKRLPIGFDFANISMAEGLRAAVATGLLLLANIWIGSSAVTIMAFAAMLTCFCDTGGPVRARVPALLAFTLAGAAIWSLFGLLHAAGWAALIGGAGFVVFCNSFVRVWGVRAQAVGNVLTVVLALSVDRSLSVPAAVALFAAFAAGGCWAILLTIGIWRTHPNRLGARMVAATWQRLADLTRDLTELTASGETDTLRWDAHARSHRRTVRDALEESRELLVASVRSPGPVMPEGARTMLGLEAAEQVFGALIALSELLEATSDPAVRSAGVKVLRRLRPALVLLGREIEGVSDRVETSLDRMETDAVDAPVLSGIVGVLVDRLRLAFGLKREQVESGPTLAFGSQPFRLNLRWQQVLSNLTWKSAVMRHATRAAVLTLAATAVTLAWWTPYAHWLTITVALTMQPYFAATWQRALERIGGTVLGAAIGASLAFVPPSPLNHAILLIPLCVLGFSVRQVSYGAYIACLTPLTVLLFEVAEPGHSAWIVAAWRTAYTIGGGGIAVLACMVVWPSWEPDRTRAELRKALRAHADYARAVLDLMSGQGDEATLDDTRRRAGLASNNLEASLSRALQEPRRGRARRLDALLAADAALRRLGGGFVALRFDPAARDGVEEAQWRAWRDWLPAALERLALEERKPDRAPEAPSKSTLARLGRGVELLGGLVEGLRRPEQEALPTTAREGSARKA